MNDEEGVVVVLVLVQVGEPTYLSNFSASSTGSSDSSAAPDSSANHHATKSPDLPHIIPRASLNMRYSPSDDASPTSAMMAPPISSDPRPGQSLGSFLRPATPHLHPINFHLHEKVPPIEPFSRQHPFPRPAQDQSSFENLSSVLLRRVALGPAQAKSTLPEVPQESPQSRRSDVPNSPPPHDAFYASDEHLS